MTGNIDYKKFIKYVHDKFSDNISIQEVEQLLLLEDDYNKDNPASLGKSLVLNRIFFKGKKITGEDFSYDRSLYKGINVWIADNGMGKSTVFKVIKYALTGKNSTKSDVRDWISEIHLEFQIGDQVYTVYINKTKHSSEGALYKFDLNSFLKAQEQAKLDIIETNLVFSFKGDEPLQNQMQTFFFNEFSYYSLRYTQQNSSKDTFKLNTANLSWATYFKSIYLESGDHGYLFLKENYGSQGKKIFEMILGLKLTYPINRLTVLMNKEDEQIAKLKILHESKEKSDKTEKIALQNELADISGQLETIDKAGTLAFDEKPLLVEIAKLRDEVNESKKLSTEVSGRYYTAKRDRDKLEAEVGDHQFDAKVIESEISKLKKRQIDLQLYTEAGSFFTNLEIKTCPHCEVDVKAEKIKNEISTHTCKLCGETPLEKKIDDGELNAKNETINGQISEYNQKLTKSNGTINTKKATLAELRKNTTDLYNQLASLPSTEIKEDRINNLTTELDSINRKRKELSTLIGKADKLRGQKAVLEFRLSELNKQHTVFDTSTIESHQLRKNIFQYAIDSLKDKRQKLNKVVLEKLQTLILSEINAFGLHNITKVDITEDYDLIFTQNHKVITFDDLNEGEKLRAKLAFYLSIIQLDIEHQLGRHPRFIIFDSPGSEEMVDADVKGLSIILKQVNERFGENLQIFVGSAIRDFSDIASSERVEIKEKDIFVF